MKSVIILCFLAICGTKTVNGLSSAIPKQLIKCYRSNFTNTLLKPPLTSQLLIELIREIEFKEKNSLDMRMFTTSLLHSMRFDGVQRKVGTLETEFVIPYRASGNQFNKYELLVDYLTSGKAQLTPYNKISTKELCLLHEIISNTVHVWNSGNEGRSCPELRSMEYHRNERSQPSVTVKSSRCPLESGIVKTRWGTISPGHIIAGIASALQETTLAVQEVIDVIQKDKNITKKANAKLNLGTVSNVGVSTLIGDLAEVTLYQASDKPKIGNSGVWNNSYIPRLYYIKDEPFEMTSAELLGGIDGAIFAAEIKNWLSQLRSTRLSQLLDMYYSQRGISYDKSFKACERGSKIEKVLGNINLVEQTTNIAKLLMEIGSGSSHLLQDDDIKKLAQGVINKFNEEKDTIIKKYATCEQDIDQVQPLEVISILDQTWTGFNAEKFAGALSKSVDLSVYGSTLGIINGQSGAWMTNITYSLVKLYDDLYNKRNLWQTSFSLSKGLEAVITYLQNQTFNNCKAYQRVPRTTVILVMANSAPLTANDVSLSSSAIGSIKNLYPEIRIFYITSPKNSKNYEELAKQYRNDEVITIAEYNEVIISKIVKTLSKIPSRIMNFYCNNSQILEDYVTPGTEKIYEIHAEYLKRASFLVKFKGNNYGSAQICVYDSIKPADRLCKEVITNEEVEFQASNYCLSEYTCNVQFSISIINPKFQCSELDCRYPDQFRVDIITNWKSSASVLTYNSVLIILISFLIFVK